MEEGERDCPFITAFLNYPQQTGLDQAAARSQNSLWVSHTVGGNPNTWAVICCPPLACLIRNLD